ncbi:aldolase/citrate lyase family protein [Chlorobium sp. N1]|uniref:aldolase/citrate lyase family protein n=1 Tax=Chlorobium sp. N1 TaxID=2491138 RepID=UPI001040207A|nr:aldolase/citrate lyase family protein [Chlorobium sp. N1]TCD47958.1 citrate lyase beta subunit [Chlorobium sp. N1]
MNELEYQMMDVLMDLKEKGAIEIKAEFEAEGSRLEELMRLSDVASKAGIPIILKIGGVEAITDIYNALLIGAKGIIAPMAETPFAVSKFLNAIEVFVAEDNRKDIEFAINIETITAFNNLDVILDLPNIDLLHGITIGRGDLVESMNYKRNEVDRQDILEMSISIAERVKDKGLKLAIGGSITGNSESFLTTLNNKGLLDKFETRKIAFDSAKCSSMVEGINLALNFELLWLKSKRRYYHRIKIEDEYRIEALEKRVMMV